MTNKEAWRKGYIDGFKGLNPRPDYPLVGLAGSYRLGYEAGYKRRKEPKGPKRNPKRADLSWEEAERLGILKRAGVTRPLSKARDKFFNVTWYSSLRNKRVGFIRPIRADNNREAIAIAKEMITNDPKAKGFTARELKRNGIVEAAAGLQALEYIGGKAKRASLGRKPKFNPRTRGSSSPSQSDRFAYRGFLFKRNPFDRRWYVSKDGFHYGSYESVEKAKAAIDDLLRASNPRAKGSRDALGVLHAENPDWQIGLYRNGKLYSIYPDRKSAAQSAKDHVKAERQYGFKPARWTVEQLKKKNPSVTALSEKFQGEADGSIDQLHAADGAPTNLARAGKLVFLKVKGRTFRIPGATVAIAPNEKLWIVGKPPLFETKARNGEGLDVGEVTHICYETAKAHIGDGKTFEYVHEFGEDGGRRPHLIIDHEGMPILRGGDYKIRAEGIVN